MHFEKVSGLKAYNLSQMGKVGPLGFYLVGAAYLQHHPKPKAIFLCMTPFAFQVGAKQTGGTLAARFLANYGPEVPGMVPSYKSVEFFAKRGITQTWRSMQIALGYHPRDPRDLPMFSKSKAGESYRDLQRRLAEGRGYWLPVGLRGPGWNARQGWPGQPVKVDGEWDDSVDRLAELCEKQGIPLFFLLTPVRGDYKNAKDYSAVVTWMSALRDRHRLTVVDPTLNFWDPDWHWDVIHLNARGAAKFTAQIAKDVQAALSK